MLLTDLPFVAVCDVAGRRCSSGGPGGPERWTAAALERFAVAVELEGARRCALAPYDTQDQALPIEVSGF